MLPIFPVNILAEQATNLAVFFSRTIDGATYPDQGYRVVRGKPEDYPEIRTIYTDDTGARFVKLYLDIATGARLTIEQVNARYDQVPLPVATGSREPVTPVTPFVPAGTPAQPVGPQPTRAQPTTNWLLLGVLAFAAFMVLRAKPLPG